MTTAVIAIVIMFSLVMLEVPIAFALFFVGFGGAWFLKGFNVAATVVHYTPFATILSGEVSALPLFILVGAFALSAGVATSGYKTARLWLGKLPGGLGVATIAASSAFASCSGSSIAGAVTMGKIAIPEMKENGYSDSLNAGICGAGGLLATMIPPSGMMVLYGLVTNESIGKLLLAGVVPGLIIALLFIAGIVVTAIMDPKAAPLVTETITWKERWRSIPQVWGIVAIFGTIFIGIFSGLFTSTESAAWGCFAALMTIVINVRKGFTKKFIEACVDSAEVTVSIFFLVLGAYVFSNFLVLAGLPEAIASTLVGSHMSPTLILLAMIATYFLLGMFLDGVTILLLTMPIYYPVIEQLGFNGIWFGIIVVAMIEIGMVTPPFGMVAYAINAIAPDIDLVKVFKGCGMFVVLELAVVALLMVFPEIPLWLPNLMK